MDGSSKTMKIDRKYENIVLLLFCFLAVAIWALPIWFTPGMVGIYDWDSSMHKFEAIRRTVLEFSQWQGHDPWTVGGVPLVGNPAIGGLLSIKGIGEKVCQAITEERKGGAFKDGEDLRKRIPPKALNITAYKALTNSGVFI